MNMILNNRVGLICLAVLAITLAGCSTFDPRVGTRVTLSASGLRGASREQLARTCQYLVLRGKTALHVENARIDSFRGGEKGDEIVLLLPGKRVNADDVRRLVQDTSVKLYILAAASTEKFADRPWRMQAPERAGQGFLFTGKDKQSLDSRRDAAEILRRVVGAPETKPLLDSAHVLPAASSTAAGKQWAVLIEFDKEGGKIFEDCTRKHCGEYLAVFLDDKLVSAPLVNTPISGGKAFVTGFHSAREANAAVDSINLGKSPLRLKIKSVKYH